MRLPENKWLRAALPALLIHCSIGTVYCWSSFSAALADAIGAAPQRLGFAFSLAIFFLGMSAAFAGPFIERNVHKAALVACLFFTTGMVGTGWCIRHTALLGTNLSLAGIFLFYGVIMGIGLGIGYLTPVKTLMLWFSRNKGLGTGISIMGFGLAKAIASPVMNHLQESIGLANMFFVLATVYFVMMMAGFVLLKKPAGWVEPVGRPTCNRLALFRNKTFLGIWTVFYLNITCGLALIAYEKPLLQTAGMGIIAISAIQALTAGANASGRLVLSTISDHLRDRNSIYKLIFFTALLACGLSFSVKAAQGGIAIALVILLIVVNAGYGGGFSTMPALLESRFGMENISTIHGLVLSAWGIAGLTGNQLAAFLLKQFNSYEAIFICLAALYSIAFIIANFVIAGQGESADLQVNRDHRLAIVKERQR